MKLLNNKEYNREDLLVNMIDDNFYYKYLGVDKVLSYSSAKWLLKSPKYFEYKSRSEMVETQALRDGKLIHTQILEPEKYNMLNFIDVSSKRVKLWTESVEKLGADNCYTLKEKNINNRIVRSFLDNEVCMQYLQGNEVEVPGLITVDNIPFRGKADILGDDFVADVKTTSDGVSELDNGKNQFEYTVSKYDYDLQAYLYTQMFDKKDFYWLVIDKTTTDIGVFKASESLLERGKAKLSTITSLYHNVFLERLIDIKQLHNYKEI